jgi:hypothetical protein
VLAIAGIGPAAPESLPGAVAPQVADGTPWAATLPSETGWFVLLSQDCDLVRDAADEPTVLIAPLVFVTAMEWQDLRRNGYSARRYAFPGEKWSGLSAGTELAVDLAWTTSILRGSLAAPGVEVVRPLTGPAKRAFAEWLSARTGRAPFPDGVQEAVLEPAYQVRKALLAKYDKDPGGAPDDARAVAACARWFAEHHEGKVTLLGQLTGATLRQAGLLNDDGRRIEDRLNSGRRRLEVKIVDKVRRASTQVPGFEVRVVLADLAEIRADQFLRFHLLMR